MQALILEGSGVAFVKYIKVFGLVYSTLSPKPKAYVSGSDNFKNRTR